MIQTKNSTRRRVHPQAAERVTTVGNPTLHVTRTHLSRPHPIQSPRRKDIHPFIPFQKGIITKKMVKKP